MAKITIEPILTAHSPLHKVSVGIVEENNVGDPDHGGGQPHLLQSAVLNSADQTFSRVRRRNLLKSAVLNQLFSVS
jgi:hypothetical protein